MDVVQFLGRFHVLLLHLPIGILFMAAFIEIHTAYKKRVRSPLLKVIWLWGAISAAGAAFLGYLLSLSGGYGEDAIATHRNWALSVIVCAFFCWFYLGKIAGHTKKIIILSLVQLVLLFATGHYGANMTHGETYLVEHAPPFVKRMAGVDVEVTKPTSLNEVQVYPHVVAPILKQRCSSCHNDTKAKGDFSVDTYTTTTANAISPGDTKNSELYVRITLPDYHDDFMPAQGKTPLTEQQVKLIEWWINTGAVNTTPFVELQATADIRTAIEQELGLGSAANAAVIEIPEADIELIKKLEKQGFHISRVQQAKPFIDVIYADYTSPLTDEKLSDLIQLKEQIMWLKLSRSNLNDTQLKKLDALSNLSKLDVSHTPVTKESISLLESSHPDIVINTFNIGVE